MEVQVREHCWQCHGNRMYGGEPCRVCKGQGYIYRWVDIGFLANKMDLYKPIWNHQRESDEYWNS
jgi:hypothetical protein